MPAIIIYPKVVEGLLPLDSPGRTMVARATFMNTQLDDGWTKLEVVTNENVTDAVQAEAAGMAEGHLTWQVTSLQQFIIIIPDPE